MGRWVLAGSHNGEKVLVERRNGERGTGRGVKCNGERGNGGEM